MLEASLIERLRRVGFIHVTGLSLKERDFPVLKIQAQPEERGCWDRAPNEKKSRCMCITTEGEVWILGGDIDSIDSDLLHAVCPNGRWPKATWPTFWAISSDDLLQRNRDPYWNYERYDPTPEEVKAYALRQRSLVGI